MRRFVVIVQSDGFDDYIHSAARGHHVPQNEILACLEPYILNDRFTLVFDLDGTPSRILPNSEKGKTVVQTDKLPDPIQVLRDLFEAGGLEDHFYAIREREGLGWDGPRMMKWGKACEAARKLMR
jgi:hypothetical protein